MNASPQKRCKCSEIICNVGQFLTLLVSICTLVLLLLMIFLVTGPNDGHYAGHSELLPPRPDVALWLQQISGFTWMPTYFQTWSSELKIQQNQTFVEGKIILIHFFFRDFRDELKAISALKSDIRYDIKKCQK